MNYLFFDIESIDRAHKTICTFGYVLTDNRFNILQKEDIIINPNLQDSELDKWALNKIVKYPLDQIRANPTFDKYYEKIKNLIQDSQTIVFGYGLINDVAYVNSESKRYNKELIIDDNVKLFEVQDIYKKYSGDKNPMGLKKLAQSLEIDISHLAAHKSSDDAEITMLVAKCLLKKLDINGRNIRKYITKADKYM